MQIEKGCEEITSIRKITKTDFTLTNKAGDIREIAIEKFVNDDEMSGYDNDETIYNDGEQIDDWDEFILEFAGEDEDADKILDELRDKIEV